MNIRDKIHPSKQPAGATHYNEDWRCSETEGIQYFKVGVGEYHFWSGGRWVIGNTRMPSSTITPLPNLQIETYAAAIQAVEGAAKEFVVTEAKRMLADPTDELGKVWDVLHAAGINSGGELSASEGVKLLAELQDYKKWYDEAMCASNEAGFAGVSAADTIKHLHDENAPLRAALAGMLFEFDDGVGGPHSGDVLPVLNHARKLVDAKQWGEG